LLICHNRDVPDATGGKRIYTANDFQDQEFLRGFGFGLQPKLLRRTVTDAIRIQENPDRSSDRFDLRGGHVGRTIDMVASTVKARGRYGSGAERYLSRHQAGGKTQIIGCQ